MAFTDAELHQHEASIANYLERARPPEKIRSELDLGCRIENQSVVIFEIRPYWRDRSRILEIPVAKTTFIRKRGVWKVFWRRADLNWHGYEPALYARSLDDFFSIVKEDRHACFFG